MLATPMAVVMTAPGQNRIRLIVCLVTAHPGGSSFLERASVFATLRRDKESNVARLTGSPLARGVPAGRGVVITREQRAMFVLASARNIYMTWILGSSPRMTKAVYLYLFYEHCSLLYRGLIHKCHSGA